MAVLTLALGIGGVMLAFSLVKGVLLRPLPFPSDRELVVLRQQSPEGNEEGLSFPNYDDLRMQSRTFRGIAALRFPSETTILGGQEPTRGVELPVSREFFTVLGATPFLGRPILPEENRPGGAAVCVVGYEFWSRVLGSSRQLDELRLTISGRSYAVVGVMPPGFKVLEDADVYLPLEHGAFMKRSSSNYVGIGRLAEAAGVREAQSELDTIVSRIQQANPDTARLDRVIMRPLREEVLGAITRPLFLLLVASGLVLVLACSNVASTLMARSVRRERELAIRAALGGGRVRLVRLVLVESLLLAGLAGTAGAGLALATLQFLKSAAAGFIPRLASVSVDGSVLSVAIGASVATALLSGLVPALRLPDPAGPLRSGSQGAGSRTANAGWSLLVGGQVALTVCLAVVSGLLTRSMIQILSADTNLRPQGLLTVSLDFTGAGQEGKGPRLLAALDSLSSEWRALPGVTGVGMVTYLPQDRSMMTGGVFRPPMPASGMPEHLALDVGWRIVDLDYFRVMGIPLRRGRFFTREDGAASRPAIILNEPLARALFPSEEAVGSVVCFSPFWEDTHLEVIGVVAEARDWRVARGEQLEGYVLTSQQPAYARMLTAVLRTEGRPELLIGPARERLRSVAPNVPGTFRTLTSLVADSYRDRTFTLGVLGAFTILSLFLSAVGVYGVVGYTVSIRAREFGIRLALGARRWELRAQVFRRTARVVLAGTVAGVGLAMAAGGVVRSLLYQVEPWDPMTMALAPLVLVASASVAILVPVVQHTRVDPVQAMRVE